MANTNKKDEMQPIIVKKIKKGGGGHHGGAWKVAYADFVTAMMAFFLLLWLLNVSTDEARNTISNYFDPSHPNISDRASGAGGLMGGRSMATEGAQATDVQDLVSKAPTGVAGQEEMTVEQLKEKLEEEENERFDGFKEELEKRLEEDPALKEMSENLIIEVTDEGLRIQIIDQEGKPLFPSGSADMFDYTKALLKTVSTVIQESPNDISIRGHTDGFQYGPGAVYTNWELSADRANSSRRALLETGVKSARVADVIGKADREHLIAEDPLNAQNRRISIILLRETVEQAFQRGAFDDDLKELPQDSSGKSGKGAKGRTQSTKPVGTFQKTPGAVYFP